MNELRDELYQYMLYYNEMRIHQSLNNITPKRFRDNLRDKERDNNKQ
ncbi:MAG: hypothetical protein LBQ18_02890 [Campylobacteraceae bacterium]|nr:hypothetical protein [Campylobacteraceae bacterium]